MPRIDAASSWRTFGAFKKVLPAYIGSIQENTVIFHSIEGVEAEVRTGCKNSSYAKRNC